MFGIGIPELILILVVALVIFGPSKLPEIGSSLGQGLRDFGRAFESHDDAESASEKPTDEQPRDEKPEPPSSERKPA